VLRDREQLALLDPFSSTMLLSTLYWPDEIRSTGELALPEDEIQIKPTERAMAEQLVAAMTGEFESSAQRDEYREALSAIIEAKAAGAEISEPAASPTATVGDLMADLEASVAAAKAGRAAGVPEPMKAAAGIRTRKSVAVGPGKAAATRAMTEEDAETIPAPRRKSA
jgi:DNA end-binding protein Ku